MSELMRDNSCGPSGLPSSDTGLAPTLPPGFSASLPVKFVFRGRPVTVDAAATPTRSVLQWLREEAHACGTKEGCAEGDCGACTVLVAELDEDEASANQASETSPACHPSLPGPLRSEGLLVRPINACIRFLPSLHGKALLTVEDLGSAEVGAADAAAPTPALHPAQAAMVSEHASQCGFCTPGFVMTLAAVHDHHRARGTQPSRPELADALAGNLCRCTGYRPILDAGQAMFQAPDKRLPLAGIAQTLRELRQLEAPASPAQAAAADPFGDGLLGASGRWMAPRRLEECSALRLAKPQARLLAGGTDIGLWMTKQFRDLGDVLWLGDVAELKKTIPLPDGGLEIRAGVALQDGWSQLAARWPELATYARRFAGPLVRHAGTLCGNLANGSPIGDAAPALMALDARLLLRRGKEEREVPLDAFYLDYMKNQLQPGEWLMAVRVPPRASGWHWQFHKLSKRFDCDISALSAGFGLKLEAIGPASADSESPPAMKVADLRLAFGGMAATVRRAQAAEEAMRGQPWTEASLQAAQAALAKDFQPITDLRASASYRQRTARALLMRLWLEHRPENPLPASAWDVSESSLMAGEA